MNTDIAVEILRELWRYKTTDKYTEIEIRRALETAIEAVNGLRPHGEWLLGECWSEGFGMGENYGQYKICPFCGYKAKEEPRNFCAKCGADMRPREGEENG